jgi:hypothetical protein
MYVCMYVCMYVRTYVCIMNWCVWKEQAVHSAYNVLVLQTYMEMLELKITTTRFTHVCLFLRIFSEYAETRN